MMLVKNIVRAPVRAGNKMRSVFSAPFLAMRNCVRPPKDKSDNQADNDTHCGGLCKLRAPADMPTSQDLIFGVADATATFVVDNTSGTVVDVNGAASAPITAPARVPHLSLDSDKVSDDGNAIVREMVTAMFAAVVAANCGEQPLSPEPPPRTLPTLCNRPFGLTGFVRIGHKLARPKPQADVIPAVAHDAAAQPAAITEPRCATPRAVLSRCRAVVRSTVAACKDAAAATAAAAAPSKDTSAAAAAAAAAPAKDTFRTRTFAEVAGGIKATHVETGDGMTPRVRTFADAIKGIQATLIRVAAA